MEKEIEQKQEQCPLCGLPAIGGYPHKSCTDYEAYMADNPKPQNIQLRKENNGN